MVFCNDYGMASSNAGMNYSLAAAIQQRQKEQRESWESKRKTQLDFPMGLFSPKTKQDWEFLQQQNFFPFTERMKLYTRALFKSLVQESLINNFAAWVAKDSALFRAVVDDLLDPSSPHEYHEELVDIAKKLVDGMQSKSGIHCKSSASSEAWSEHSSRSHGSESSMESDLQNDSFEKKEILHQGSTDLGLPTALQAQSSGHQAKARKDKEIRGLQPQAQDIGHEVQSNVSQRENGSEASRIAIGGSPALAMEGSPALAMEGSPLAASSTLDEEYYEMFISVAEGMLEASHKKDLTFLDHILKCCHNWSKLCADGLHFWHHLRSVRDRHGYTPLHIAVMMGLQEVVERLVLGKYSCNIRLPGGGLVSCSPSAEQDANLGISGQRLSEWEFLKIDKVHGGEQALDEWSLLNFDVLHARTREGWTSLHLATVATGYDALAIQPEGTDVPAVVDHDVHVELTGAERARRGSFDLKWHALLSILMSLYEVVQKPVKETWDFVDNLWMTPLHYAVLANRHEAVKKLVAWEIYHEHLNAGDYHRKTPLHMAVCHSNVSSHASSPSSRLGRDQHGYLFQSYAHSGNPGMDLIRTLAECPHVNIHALDCCLYTPLHWAVHVGNTEVVRYLIMLRDSKRVRATLKDIEGRSVMQMAIESTEKPGNSKDSDEEIWDSFDSEVGTSDQLDQALMDQGVFEDIQTVLLGCDDVKQEIERLYRDRQVYVDATNAILVGAALVASVTFQGWLQPPEFDDHSRQARRWVRVFWWCNSISFYFSVASVTAGAVATLPMGKRVYIGRSVQKLQYWLSLSSLLLMISAVHVVVAFAGSGFAAMTNILPSLQKSMIITTSMGMAVCSVIIFSAFFRLKGLLLDLMIFPARVFHLAKDYGLDSVADFWRLKSSSVPLIPQKLAVQYYPRRRYQREELDDIFKMVESFDWGMSKKENQGKIQRQDTHQLDVLKFVYEEVRRRINVQSRRTKKAMKRSCCSGLSARGIHHWMTGCPVDTCRKHSLEMDQCRWLILAGRIDIFYNQHCFLNRVKDFKRKEWFAMCITLHRIDATIGLDKVGYLSFKSDWYRFSHGSFTDSQTFTGRDMLHTVGATIQVNMSIHMDLADILSMLNQKVQTLQKLENKVGRLGTFEMQDWWERWEKCGRLERWKCFVDKLDSLERSGSVDKLDSLERSDSVDKLDSWERSEEKFDRWKRSEERFERWETSLTQLEQTFKKLKERLRNLMRWLEKFKERLEILQWWEWWELLEEGLSLETWKWWKGQLWDFEEVEGNLEGYEWLRRGWQREIMDELEKKLKNLEMKKPFEEQEWKREFQELEATEGFEKRIQKFEELETGFENLIERLEEAMGVSDDS